MSQTLLRHALLALVTCALALPAIAQEGTGRKDDEVRTDEGKDLITKRTGKLTRKEKRERKQLEQERKEARKSQKRWEKMGLAARTAPEWYAEALTRYKAGKYLQAREILLPLEDSARAIDIQEKVKLLIADTYYYQGGTLNLAEALARYRTFMTFYPSSEHTEYARFQMGNCYYKQLGPADRDQTYTDNAIFEYESQLRDYPNGEYASAARERLLEAKALRARHEFEVAEFYRSWGNHEAAASRLEDLLANRPESPDREAALYLVADSLYQLGRGADAEAYAARLREDYPGSKYASKIRPTTSGKAAAALQKKARKRDKEAARTYKSQRKREERRTRQVRKDSGLPRNVPTFDSPAYEGPVTTPAAPPVQAGPTKAQRRADEKERKRQERMQRLEEKEQAERARKLEREAAQAEKQSAVDERPKSEKQLAGEAKKADKEAKKAGKHAERMEKAEAKEQAEAEREAERERKAAEKREAKEAKKEEKRLRKDEKKQ